MKLGLGTVQFGCDYGISNSNGQVTPDEVCKILKYAKSVGINLLDTAQSYGESEKTLGKFNLMAFNIVTKFLGDAELETSLKNLNLEKIYGLMFHRSSELNDKSWAKFENYKAQKLVSKIGVSVYSPSELLELVEKYPIDIVQIPMNLLDQRFLSILPLLKSKNIEVHVRSVFLQGLLLMPDEKINPYFNEIKPIISQLPKNRMDAALGFVKSIKEIDKIIIGTTSETEIRQVVDSFLKNAKIEDTERFSVSDEKFICPQNWRLN